MKKKCTWPLAALLLVGLLIGASVLYRHLSESQPAPEQLAQETTEGDYIAAPDFTVYDGEGNPAKLSDCLGKPVVLNFWASWCGPCMMLAPVMEALDGEMDGVKFCKVNVDDERDLAMEFGIESIPTLLCIKGGKVVKRLVGYREKDALKKELEAL